MKNWSYSDQRSIENLIGTRASATAKVLRLASRKSAKD